MTYSNSLKLNEIQVQRLSKYIRGLLNGEDSLKLYQREKDVFESIIPEEVFKAFTDILLEGFSQEEILLVLNKVVTLLSNHLPKVDKQNLSKESILRYLIDENEKMTQILLYNKARIAKANPKDLQQILIELFENAKEYEKHLIKKENILFPSMEKKNKIFSGLSIMWGLHDSIKDCIKEIKAFIPSSQENVLLTNKLIGRIYFLIFGLIQKENILLFPVALKLFEKKEDKVMLLQALEYGFAFDVGKDIDKEHLLIQEESVVEDLKYISDSGELSFEQLTLILGNLPVDISYVDENNTLKYFNLSKERIFPRSPASIGTNVKQCHPPKSYDAVEKVIESFRKGKQDKEIFWINLNGRLVLIEYFAIRDSSGKYRGVLEASRDITDIKEIKGEKRI